MVIVLVAAWTKPLCANAQQVGLGLGFSSASAFIFDVLYKKERNIYSLGSSFKFSDAKGKLVKQQLPNYGRSIVGRGEYFWTIDFGYSRLFTEKFGLEGQLSIGSEAEYVNYADARFTDGGYHMISNEGAVFGAGLNGIYHVSKSFSFYGGYHSLRVAQFGLRLWM